MRISDWSSDVCSSDLTQPSHNTTERGPAMPPEPVTPKQMPFDKYRPFLPLVLADRTWPDARIEKAPLWCSVEIGRASCRERVWQYGEVPVVALTLQTKKRVTTKKMRT